MKIVFLVLDAFYRTYINICTYNEPIITNKIAIYNFHCFTRHSNENF